MRTAPKSQAVLTLKGKPLNVWDLKRHIVYRNDEMYNLMLALDIEDNIEHLRYDKVILATDADVDGLHICCTNFALSHKNVIGLAHGHPVPFSIFRRTSLDPVCVITAPSSLLTHEQGTDPLPGGWTGKQLWQADQVSDSKSGASIQITAVPSAGCAFLFTDRGDLILARLVAAGYQELGRFHLLDPTAEYGSRKMAWVPLAFSGRRIFARNDKEIVCASLAAVSTR